MVGNSILPVDIEEEMKESYLSYAMSVIVARALPDVRDGLKPVHRRILYSMYELGNTHDKPYKKSARIVGEVLGKYHPHGDAAIYDTLVRMGQPFSLRYPLVDGQGNFGSIDGDPPAAMRYTEVRMSKISEEMVRELSEDTVDFVPNFDNTLKEPTVLPARFPQLVVNGSSGIAVAMVSSIPPHNLGEVVDALIAIIDGKDEEEALSYVRGPDFPTGGIVIAGEGLEKAYKTGKGRIHVLAKAKVDGQKIVITEIPYMVSKRKIIEDIVRVVKSNIVQGIADVHDRSDKRGLALEIVVKKGYNAENVLHKLYEHTSLKTTFSIISIALVDGKPKLLPFVELLREFLRFREETVRRRTTYRLKKAEKRAHIIEGLLKALSKIDDTVKLLKAAKDVSEAKAQLISLLSIDEEQAQAILDMKLQKIVSLEREKLEAEHRQLSEEIAGLKAILENREKLLAVIKEELLEIKNKYADERKTEILGDYVQKDVVEKTVVVYTKEGYLKRLHPSVFKVQHRGGVGIRLTSNDQTVKEVLTTDTGSELLVFTDRGKVHKLEVRRIPLTERYAKGMYIGNFIRLEEGEKPITIARFVKDGYILMITAKGIVKRVSMNAFSHIRAGGIRAISFRDGDALVDVAYSTTGEEKVFVATVKGKAILFPQEHVRETGRSSMGVRAISLSDSDEVANISTIREADGAILTVTSTGYGRFTAISDYRVQNRGGSGIINIKLKDHERVVFSKYVPKEAQLIMSSAKGMVIKIVASQIPQYGRSSHGVRLMRLKDDEVASVAVMV